jgi:hypothetical protein
MESSNTNHEDKDNEGNSNIPLATSSLEREMLEYVAAETQVLQAMAQTRFAEKPLSFPIFTKIPFHHRSFFTV